MASRNLLSGWSLPFSSHLHPKRTVNSTDTCCLLRPSVKRLGRAQECGALGSKKSGSWRALLHRLTEQCPFPPAY